MNFSNFSCLIFSAKMCYHPQVAYHCSSDNQNESDNGSDENETNEVPSKRKKTEKN